MGRCPAENVGGWGRRGGKNVTEWKKNARPTLPTPTENAAETKPRNRKTKTKQSTTTKNPKKKKRNTRGMKTDERATQRSGITRNVIVSVTHGKLGFKKNLGKIQLNPFESFLEANSGRVNTFTSEIWTAAHTAWMRTKEQWIEWNWLKIVKIDWESASERKRRIKGSTENRGTRFWRNGQSDRKRPVGRGKKKPSRGTLWISEALRNSRKSHRNH